MTTHKNIYWHRKDHTQNQPWLVHYSVERHSRELLSILVYGIPDASHEDQAARFC